MPVVVRVFGRAALSRGCICRGDYIQSCSTLPPFAQPVSGPVCFPATVHPACAFQCPLLLHTPFLASPTLSSALPPPDPIQAHVHNRGSQADTRQLPGLRVCGCTVRVWGALAVWRQRRHSKRSSRAESCAAGGTDLVCVEIGVTLCAVCRPPRAHLPPVSNAWLPAQHTGLPCRTCRPSPPAAPPSLCWMIAHPCTSHIQLPFKQPVQGTQPLPLLYTHLKC